MSTSDVETLLSIFAHRPGLSAPYLQHILTAHAGDLHRACDYILTLSDRDIAHANVSPAVQRNHHPSTVDLADSENAARLIENLKDIAIPALKAHLDGLRFPDLCGETERVKYSLAGLVLDTIKLQPSNVDVSVEEGRQVHVIARDVAISVDVDHWAYRLRLPPIRDAGRAHFEVAGVAADVLLAVDQRTGVLSVDRCSCSITGAISFRAADARLSWVYNTVAPMLKNACRPALEATLTHAIRDGLDQQLSDWARWATEGTDVSQA